VLGAQDSGGFTVSCASLPWRLPVNGLAGMADLWNSWLAGKPFFAALQAFMQSDYVHVLTVRMRIRRVVACEQPLLIGGAGGIGESAGSTLRDAFLSDESARRICAVA